MLDSNLGEQVNHIFSFMKAASPVEPIQDQEKVKENYQYWRIRIFYSMFVGYAFFYLTRKSFTFAMPALIADLGFGKAELGILATILSLSYGLSKFVSGILQDRSNARYFMAFGLIATGMTNIFFGFSSSLFFFAVFWGLNGWFQGFGWPPCARLLTQWYSQNERGSWWSSWNVSHNVGAAVIPIIVAICISYSGWRLAMYVPGVLCILGGLFLLNRLRDTPESLGLPPIEKFRDDYGNQKSSEVEAEKKLSTKELMYQYVLYNPVIWMLAISYFFVYVVRIGVNDWSALFLIESKGYSQMSANGCVSFFEIGGFVGSLTAGWLSDRLFSAQRGPVNVLFAVGMLLSIGCFWLVPQGHFWLDYLAMFFVGFTVFGPQMMIGLAAAELSHKRAAATATGFTGWFGYVGGAVAGYPLGKLAQDFGWAGFYWAIIACCAISILLLIPLWPAQAPKSEPELA